VEVTARLVERLSLDSEHRRFRLSLDGREAECTVATAESPSLTSLVSADVLIRAVPITSRSTSGSVVGLQLYVPPRGNVIAVRPRPAASTPLATGWRLTQPGPGLPLLTSALQVKGLSHEEAFRHYPVRLRAVVTFLDPESSGPVLQDRSTGIYARTAPEDRQGWRLGDLVEIDGVTSSGGFSPTVWTRAAHRLGPGVLPAPRPFRGLHLFGRDENAWVRLSGVVRSVGRWQKSGLTVDARLVSLSGFLVSHNSVRGDHVLTMSAGRRQFTAVLEHPRYEDFLESLTEGSKLQLTGICHVDFDALRFPPQPKGFEILVPSVADIRLLQRAPWWTLRKALMLAGVIVGVVLLILAWVVALRRRVAAQATILRERMDHERRLQAKLEEAQRMESLGRLAGGWPTTSTIC
jgi:hypothetical protein